LSRRNVQGPDFTRPCVCGPVIGLCAGFRSRYVCQFHRFPVCVDESRFPLFPTQLVVVKRLQRSVVSVAAECRAGVVAFFVCPAWMRVALLFDCELDIDSYS